MVQIVIRPLEERKPAVESILDRWFATRGIPLTVADFTPENRRRLLRPEWKSLEKLRETASWLVALIGAPSPNQARTALGVGLNKFYSWLHLLRLTMPLVSQDRQAAVLAALVQGIHGSNEVRDEDDASDAQLNDSRDLDDEPVNDSADDE